MKYCLQYEKIKKVSVEALNNFSANLILYEMISGLYLESPVICQKIAITSLIRVNSNSTDKVAFDDLHSGLNVIDYSF